MNIFDVRCPACGESGSEQRMDIRDERCYYCRMEKEEGVSRGKYYSEVNVRLVLTVYAQDAEEARLASHRIVHTLIERTGAGDGVVTALHVRRIGSGHNEYRPHKEVRR